MSLGTTSNLQMSGPYERHLTLARRMLEAYNALNTSILPQHTLWQVAITHLTASLYPFREPTMSSNICV